MKTDVLYTMRDKTDVFIIQEETKNTSVHIRKTAAGCILLTFIIQDETKNISVHIKKTAAGCILQI